ncbi:MAG TPA: T9SS type A sorting domain-containing protein [Hymenobacter sp.]|uniref:T9SS type A sorting domain-containing protein n=1 Tax=Hymenobacter sp. TaxID=1898978 RepID=UPI002D8011FC|nr:T9SS type A sorting domain-containing protein [Hymenobacter sp.]HET9502827.1 T9SS type A sorting domain-containing protein [Hymenobacter sp.]
MQKPLLFSLGLLCGATAAQAQTSPSITSSDMPAVGDSLRLSQAAPVLPAGAPALTLNGANKTWNYAGLVATAQRVARYNNVSSATGFALQFTFNNAFLSPDTKASVVAPENTPLPAGVGIPISDPLAFYNTTSADFRSVGYAATYLGTGVPVTYATKARQDIIYRLPVAYGNAPDVSNSLISTPAALASTGFFSQQRQRTNQIDAWGTLTTPFGTFQTVRVVSKLIDHDSLAIGGTAGQGLTLPTRREYKWLAKTIHVPVLAIITTEVAGQEVITSVEYRDIYRRFVPLAGRDAATQATLSAFPNPSALGEAVRLTVPAGSGPLTVAATDLLGRQVFSRSFGAGGVLTLEAAAFGNFRGVLLLTVTTAQGTATRRVVRE